MATHRRERNYSLRQKWGLVLLMINLVTVTGGRGIVQQYLKHRFLLSKNLGKYANNGRGFH